MVQVCTKTTQLGKCLRDKETENSIEFSPFISVMLFFLLVWTYTVLTAYSLPIDPESQLLKMAQLYIWV
jgi:hypothetical protein